MATVAQLTGVASDWFTPGWIGSIEHSSLRAAALLLIDNLVFGVCTRNTSTIYNEKIGNVKVMGPAFSRHWACPQGPLGAREPVREAGNAVWEGHRAVRGRPAAGIGVPASRPGGPAVPFGGRRAVRARPAAGI